MRFSFVVALRDPEYGTKHGMNNLYRTQLFVENTIHLCDAFDLPVELIFVEWNPVREGEFFERIEWPAGRGQIAVRWLTVPAEFHQRYENAAHMSIFEFSAKNVGIRRATGDFILASNPDDLYSEELIRTLATEKLSAGYYYRVDRLDVGTRVPRELGPQQRLELCSRNVVVQHTMFGSVPPLPACGAADFPERAVRLREQYWSGQGLVASPDGLHRNAAGDFFLMKRDHWWDVRGFLELPTHAHMDSIMCWQADSFGAKQVIFPAKLYHLDHERTRRARKFETNWHAWQQRYHRCRAFERAVIGNGADWGLAGESIPEISWRVGGG